MGVGEERHNGSYNKPQTSSEAGFQKYLGLVPSVDVQVTLT
jgi:hypothetical protein